MPPKDVILIRYNEIGLKLGNRSWFEKMLCRNILKMLRRVDPESSATIERFSGRMVLHAHWNRKTQWALNRVFGISSFSPAQSVPTDLSAIIERSVESVSEHFKRHGTPKTFRVKTRRSDKLLQTSEEIDRQVGSELIRHFPSLIVKLKDPQFTLGIEIRARNSYLWTHQIRGLQGLPVGTNARVLTLLSGGLDSPVAAQKLIGRGSPSLFIHFHGTPFVGNQVLEKIEDLARRLNQYMAVPQPLIITPFGKIQEKISLSSDPKFRTLLYRRAMIRIANEVAKKHFCEALVLGDSLGQVASQTVENLGSLDAISELPIFRPLIAHHKEEIIQKARELGTYEVSIRPASDTCSLFSGSHPILRSRRHWVEKEERKVDLDELLEEAVTLSNEKNFQ